MKQTKINKENAAFLLHATVECVYPRRCPFCNDVIGFTDKCKGCESVCAELELKHKRLARQTHYFGNLEGAAAVYHYEGCVRESILNMKYEGRRWYANELGNIMVKALFGCTFFRKYGIILPERNNAAALEWDVIVPVPESSKKRGYNVPDLLAKPIVQATGLPIQETALQRIRFTKSQAGLALADRLENVAGAFAPTVQCDVEGKRVLLVDDVITTGATAAACTNALLEAGAQSVYAVALASSQWQEELEYMD